MDVIQMSLAVQMQVEVVAVLLTRNFLLRGRGKVVRRFSDRLFALKTFFPGMRWAY